MPVNCCLIQFNVVYKNRVDNLLKIDNILAGASPENSIIFLPELFTSGYPVNLETESEEMNGPSMKWMSAHSVRYNSVIAGSLIIQENKSFYNRFIWCFPDGKIKFYDKRHMFCMNDEEKYLKPGQERIIIEYQGIRFLPVLCYDIRFPVWIRNKNDYEVIVCPANWPLNRKNVWNTLLRARAIENQAFILGINRTGTDVDGTIYCGESQAVDFNGNVISSLDESGEMMLKISLDINKLHEYKSKFTAWKDADEFQIKY
jgi:omega-amidase